MIDFMREGGLVWWWRWSRGLDGWKRYSYVVVPQMEST